jgi:uncharacterized phage-associated protein
MYNQTTKSFRFNEKKALNALLYVLQGADNLYNIMKVFYFADKKHLSKYGRFIYGDHYIAMKSGQVPSTLYDMIKFVGGEGSGFNEKVKDSFYIENKYKIKPKKEADLNVLSESEKECLKESVEKYGKMAYWKLFIISHSDKAYKKTERDKEMAIDKIIETLPNKEQVKAYLENMYS